MKSKTDEQALEACIELSLTGHDSDSLDLGEKALDPLDLYDDKNAYLIGTPKDFNAEYAIDEGRLWNFLENSQEEELNKIKRYGNWKLKILDRLDKVLQRYGILYVLKKGLAVEDAHFRFFYEPPNNSSGTTVRERFLLNEFSLMRQVPYNPTNQRQSIDIVLFLNGLPIVTMELKNQWTGQNARAHGINQYKYHRDNSAPLLQFARCIVHFTVDPEEAFMTTKLKGGDTIFLPFNKGYMNGKGNPPNPNGHKTAYLWEDIFQKRSMANIIENFVLLDGEMKNPLNSRTLYFPRYHQLDVVRKLVNDVTENGVGQRYLIQHSAGSGKSNSITWLAFQLLNTYPLNDTVPGAEDADMPLFNSIIVITDRRLLDRQIKDNITDFSELKSIIGHSDTSAQLRKYIEQGKRIIITTIQKFPFIVDEITDQSDTNFAVLIDEAHSSQSGSYADNLNVAMGGDYDEENADSLQDKIASLIEQRKMRNNTSYFAFTATPKNSTLEKFGEKQEDGSFKPFHLYSMKQAIEEGFILDVLRNYTTYKSYYEITKSIADNPEFETKRAQQKLRGYVERHPDTINTKAGIMLNHFIEKVYKTKKLQGKAKGMVLTQDIESAIHYYNSLSEKLNNKGNPFKILIAFSGKKTVDGIEYSEAQMNGFSQGDTKDKFDTDEYRLLVVANKYLTGFDQPKLTTMYIDKRLSGITAVQALSRLNRSADALGKKSEDLFILDFYNTIEEMKESFDPFYTSTTLTEATDVNVLHEIKAAMDSTSIYEWHEVEKFNEKFFNGVDAQELSPILDRSAARFNSEFEWTIDAKADFKVKAKQFVKIYSQVSSILPYNLPNWEMLFWYLKFLIPKLLIEDKDKDKLDDLLNSVDLSTYGIQRDRVNQNIGLDDSDSEVDPQNPNPRGATMSEGDRDNLLEIIKTFNDRFFQGWDASPEDQRIKLIKLSEQVKNHPDFDNKVASNNDKENSELALRKVIDEVITKQRRNEIDFYKLYSQDEIFMQGIFELMKRQLQV